MSEPSVEIHADTYEILGDVAAATPETTMLLPSQAALEATAPLDPSTTLLIRAHFFLERGWCRGVLARNFLGRKVSPLSKWACRWCAYGALQAARPGYSAVDFHQAVSRLTLAMADNIMEFNDSQERVEPVLAAFDRAIAAGGASGDRSVPEGHAIAMGDASQEATR
jgi:hypothetical protein